MLPIRNLWHLWLARNCVSSSSGYDLKKLFQLTLIRQQFFTISPTDPASLLHHTIHQSIQCVGGIMLWLHFMLHFLSLFLMMNVHNPLPHWRDPSRKYQHFMTSALNLPYTDTRKSVRSGHVLIEVIKEAVMSNLFFLFLNGSSLLIFKVGHYSKEFTPNWLIMVGITAQIIWFFEDCHVPSLSYFGIFFRKASLHI